MPCGTFKSSLFLILIFRKYGVCRTQSRRNMLRNMLGPSASSDCCKINFLVRTHRPGPVFSDYRGRIVFFDNAWTPSTYTRHQVHSVVDRDLLPASQKRHSSR